MITTIKECKECGVDNIRGFGDVCVWCGAMDNNWDIQCTCGNSELWGEEMLAVECPKCGTHSQDFVVTAVDSAFIINSILKRPDLHRMRVFVPILFVDALIEYINTTDES